jgi:hypothetical protein
LPWHQRRSGGCRSKKRNYSDWTRRRQHLFQKIFASDAEARFERAPPFSFWTSKRNASHNPARTQQPSPACEEGSPPQP